jgi:hypothetical protein
MTDNKIPASSIDLRITGYGSADEGSRPSGVTQSIISEESNMTPETTTSAIAMSTTPPKDETWNESFFGDGNDFSHDKESTPPCNEKETVVSGVHEESALVSRAETISEASDSVHESSPHVSPKDMLGSSNNICRTKRGRGASKQH